MKTKTEDDPPNAASVHAAITMEHRPNHSSIHPSGHAVFPKHTFCHIAAWPLLVCLPACLPAAFPALVTSSSHSLVLCHLKSKEHDRFLQGP